MSSHENGAQSAENGLPVEALRDAFRDWAHVLTPQTLSVDEQLAQDRADLDAALRSHGVTLNEADLSTVHDLLRKRSFMGGNYTLDAKAAHAALTRPLPSAKNGGAA